MYNLRPVAPYESDQYPRRKREPLRPFRLPTRLDATPELPESPEVDSGDGRLFDRFKTAGRRIVQDARETLYDFRDEPGEVIHRIGERAKDYFPKPHYRNGQGDDPRIMAKPVGDGQYGEQMVGPNGRISGFGDSRDYAPLAQAPRAVATADDGRTVSPPTLNPNDTLRNPVDIPGVGAPPIMVTRNNKGRPVAAVGGDNDISRNMELIKAQEGYKAPRSTKDQILAFMQGGIPGGIAYATDQNTRNRWAVGDDINKEEGAIQREQAIGAKQAAIHAAQMRPVAQQSAIDTRNDAQDEREINNALTQYNRLGSYDPETDIGLRQYFESRKLNLPAKTKGSNVVANWSNGRLVLTDKTSGVTRPAMEGETVVTDMGRTPNVGGLTPNQQAGIDSNKANRISRESEGGKNRTLRERMAGQAEAGRNTRQQRSLSAPSKRAGVVAGADEQLYGKAKSYWAEAQVKRQQADSIKPQPGYELSQDQAATKARLLREAGGLENRTRKLQEEGDKLRRTGAVSTATPAASGSGKKWSLSRWQASNPDKDANAAKAEAERRGWTVTQ